MNEFEFINHIKKKFRAPRIGDDCAVLPMNSHTDLVITSDMLVEGIDFRLEWTKPEFIGQKVLAVSLSDIASMGATPRFSQLSIAVPERLWTTAFLDRLYEGWYRLARLFSVELVGGDISKTDGPLVLDCTILGEVSKGKAILRSGANVGDSIYVTGPLGAAAAGLNILTDPDFAGKIRTVGERSMILKQVCPDARTITGQMLGKSGIPSAMIDISDGLSSDLAHLCNASQVGARMYADRIPLDPLSEKFFYDRHYAFELALNGGEDFELLFTANEAAYPAQKLAQFIKIGEITSHSGKIELVRDGEIAELQPQGYLHFGGRQQ